MKPDQIHPQQARENPECAKARARCRFVIGLTAALLVFGVIYIARSGLTNPPQWAMVARPPSCGRGARCGRRGGGWRGGIRGALRGLPPGQRRWHPGRLPAAGRLRMGARQAGDAGGRVLHGASGPLTVKGGRFDGAMPPFGAQLNDAELAAVLTHIRSSWGNNAPAVDAASVAAVRKGHGIAQRALQGRCRAAADEA